MTLKSKRFPRRRSPYHQPSILHDGLSLRGQGLNMNLKQKEFVGLVFDNLRAKENTPETLSFIKKARKKTAHRFEKKDSPLGIQKTPRKRMVTEPMKATDFKRIEKISAKIMGSINRNVYQQLVKEIVAGRGSQVQRLRAENNISYDVVIDICDDLEFLLELLEEGIKLNKREAYEKLIEEGESSEIIVEIIIDYLFQDAFQIESGDTHE